MALTERLGGFLSRRVLSFGLLDGDGHSTRRCYLGGLWGKLFCFGSLDLFTRKTRHLRSAAFMVQHAKHTKWTSFNSLGPPAGKVEFMSPHLSGVLSFYSCTHNAASLGRVTARQRVVSSKQLIYTYRLSIKFICIEVCN